MDGRERIVRTLIIVSLSPVFMALAVDVYRNYKCYCEEGYNGPNCEYESNPKAVRKSYAQDNFETIIDLQPIASSTHMKINSLLNVAQFFNRTFNIDFKIYVDSEGPMIYDWVSGKRQRLNVELTKDAFAYTKEYKLDDYHKTNYVFTTSYDFVQDYNATEFPWYFGHSSKNPNWHKRISVFVYYAQDCSSWKKTNDQPECPMDYLVAIDKSRQMAKDDYHKRTIFFGIKINDSKNRICEVQSTNGFWFVIWIVSMIGFLGLIVLLVSPRYSTTLQNHLNSIFGKNNDGVEMNEMLLGQH
ncbi:hypothetical protein M3Y95_00543600 [Aphelenchoides besseyi]|nr:hypothetical protein M3Y95_00543600 [Aphelenchoides besseyi]